VPGLWKVHRLVRAVRSGRRWERPAGPWKGEPRDRLALLTWSKRCRLQSKGRLGVRAISRCRRGGAEPAGWR
jgi:hypothetical protein